MDGLYSYDRIIKFDSGLSGMSVITKILNISSDILNEWKEDNEETLYLYRGQANSMWELLPGLFRVSDRDLDFEYNMIHFLKANKFVESSDELSISIDAQHYSYPTRLLDVSYNILNALYFACETTRSYDQMNEDGTLFIIKVRLQCPGTSQNLHNIYANIIENSKFYECMPYNDYLFVERINQNNRIVAQDGGLIIFLDDKPMAKSYYKKIVIGAGNKEKIIEALKSYFNIMHGNMYPDIENNRQTYVKAANQQRFSKYADWDLMNDILTTYISRHLGEIDDIRIIEDKNRAIKRLIRRLTKMEQEYDGVKNNSACRYLIGKEIERLEKKLKSKCD